MPNRPTAGGAYIPGGYLNSCNTQFVTGQGDPYTGAAYQGGGLTAGVVIEVSDAEAQPLSDPGKTTKLYGGAYQWVQVDSGASATQATAGRAAFLKLDVPGVGAGVEPESGYSTYLVTTETGADSTNLFCGVFVNTITPGNWGFIFVGAGRVNVTYKSSLTNGAPAIGDGVEAGGGSGLFDDVSTTSLKFAGRSVTTAVANGTSAIWIKDLIYRI